MYCNKSDTQLSHGCFHVQPISRVNPCLTPLCMRIQNPSRSLLFLIDVENTLSVYYSRLICICMYVSFISGPSESRLVWLWCYITLFDGLLRAEGKHLDKTVYNTNRFFSDKFMPRCLEVLWTLVDTQLCIKAIYACVFTRISCVLGRN